jgi:ABC-2 type transport system ATP-binding protein
VIRSLDDAGVAVDDIAIHRPSLDDVFFALTGRPAEMRDDDPAGSDELVEV